MDFFNKKNSGGTVKNDGISNKELAKELQNQLPIIQEKLHLL